MTVNDMASDMVAARVRKVRKRRGWQPADLAARCAELGAGHLTENAIENIESGRRAGGRRRRTVTVDELLILALALNVAPVHLLVPPDDGSDPYPVTATMAEPSYRVRGWIRGLYLLARLPKVGDKWDFFKEAPADELEAMQEGQCPVCGGRRTQWVETAPDQWVKKEVGPDGEHR
jgi:transcriptional regulator with XRE-family HTH domain